MSRPAPSPRPVTDLHALGQLELARQLDEDTLTRARQVLNEDHIWTMGCASGLANDLRALGEVQAARHIGEDTLVRAQRVLGDEGHFTMHTANNLAAALRLLSSSTYQEIPIPRTNHNGRAGRSWRQKIDKAFVLRTQPENCSTESRAKQWSGRNQQALNDYEVAISLDPFAYELMVAKFNVLPQLDRPDEAVKPHRYWRQKATMRVYEFRRRIIQKITHKALSGMCSCVN